MATELQAFQQARQSVMQAAAPMMGMMRDRVAVKREEIERDRKLADDKRLRDEARADWIERFNIQTNAAKEAAKASRQYATQERESSQIYRTKEREGSEAFTKSERRAGEIDADYVYWRNRQDQLADRGWAVEQDEKEMRLKAAQLGMPNATDPSTSIEDVYKHIYDSAPEELAKARKKQSDAFRRLNPKIHETYDAIVQKRVSLKNQISDLIKNNQGATGLELANALIPELIAQGWNLAESDIQNIRDNGLAAIAAVIVNDEAKKAEIRLIMDKVSTETLSRNAKNLNDNLALLLREDGELLRTMQRIETANPTIGLEDPEAYTDAAANKQLGESLGGGASKFGNLPTSVSGAEGAVAETTDSVVATPPPAMQGAEPITAPKPRWTRGGADTSEIGEPQLSPEAFRMSNADLGEHYNFPELKGNIQELEKEKAEITGRLSRQSNIAANMRRNRRPGGNDRLLNEIEEGMRRHEVRLGDIDQLLFKLNQPKAEPMTAKDYINEQSILRGMGYPDPNRKLGDVEKAERTIQGDNWIDPRTVGPEERRLLQALPTTQYWR
jgi:hypothetical protein